MGVGRRMKKQGPPAPLDKSMISSLKKRKAGEPDSTPDSGKKRRKAEAKAAPATKPKPSTKTNGPVEVKKRSVPAKELKKGPQPAAKSNGQKKPLPVDEELDEEEDDEISDDDAADLMDGFNSEDDSDAEMGDEFEGSDLDELDEDEDNSVFDSDEDHPRENMWSDDDDESDAEEKLTAANIAGLSRKLDEEKEAQDAEAEQELQEAAMQTNIAGDQLNVLDDDSAAAKPGLAPNLQLLRARISETIRILGDLVTLGQPGKSRADYTARLIEDICTYYGYTPYLAEKLFSLFTPMEAFAFFEANESPRPVVIRTNTLRTNRRSLAQALINRGVVLEPVGKWSKVGLQVFESAVPLGATPEYLAGHYILQAASSFLPVMALAPQPHERILDMAAAPGGKTTYISALMRNTGCVLANDASKSRAKGLIGNIHRLGCKNTIVSHYDAREAFPKILGGFDRILLDAPCSGTGVIAKDPNVKTSKTHRDFLALPHMQKQLLLSAIDSVDHASKTGGYIVYSTCSVTVEENEQVVQYVLRKRPNVKLVDTGLGSFGSEGFTSYMGKKFDEKMSLTRRYFPHRENVDGFFVSKLKKTGPSPSSKAGAATTANGAARSGTDPNAASDDEVIDKTPIVDEEGKTGTAADAFGPFDEEEDAEVMARAERNKLRKKGINPKGVLGKKTQPKKKGEGEGESKAESEDAKSAPTPVEEKQKKGKKAEKPEEKKTKAEAKPEGKKDKKEKKKKRDSGASDISKASPSSKPKSKSK